MSKCHKLCQLIGRPVNRSTTTTKCPILFSAHVFTYLLTCCSASGQVVVEQAQAEALAAAAAAGDSLICQAIINSGIALGTEEAIVEENPQATEEIDKVDSDCAQADEDITEIQVKEEFVELEMEAEVRIRHLLHCF